ncbi:tripartite tricarboxylate transporter substrate binding protein [Ramlibacter tataouinensis]|uniref:tripartite tricarboxylate transporter substrate binding protein n=1 Tax=Ramlibacter tataouinensis TaxID=94132 RepID=UPI0022F3F3F0|nr:tripartite tricarboxylate transporter substrate binding protein [Ramlibacter tataouinensis]WBY01544.1 tripartite tricarboxylate transporter substrate binding protein [Ramlibacter tataouinensis]
MACFSTRASGVSRRLSIALLAALGTGAALAAFPERPIRIVVPFPAGGGTDIVARVIGPHLSAELKQPVVFENKAGASTVIGTEAVANAPADGYTLLFTSSAFTANASLIKSLPYDPLRTFTPIGSAALHPFVLVAHPSLPANNLKELIAYAKANPGKLNYASVGPGSSQHLGMELLKRMAGVDIAHIPYRGSAPAMTDLLGGQVNLMFNGVSPTLQHIRTGKLKVLATDADRRVSVLPDVPTVAEAALPGYKITTWSGLLAPAAVPADVRERLAAAWTKAMAVPEVQKALTDRGLVPNPLAPAQFAQMLGEDKEAWAKLVRDTKVEPE